MAAPPRRTGSLGLHPTPPARRRGCPGRRSPADAGRAPRLDSRIATPSPSLHHVHQLRAVGGAPHVGGPHTTLSYVGATSARRGSHRRRGEGMDGGQARTRTAWTRTARTRAAYGLGCRARQPSRARAPPGPSANRPAGAPSRHLVGQPPAQSAPGPPSATGPSRPPGLAQAARPAFQPPCGPRQPRCRLGKRRLASPRCQGRRASGRAARPSAGRPAR